MSSGGDGMRADETGGILARVQGSEQGTALELCRRRVNLAPEDTMTAPAPEPDPRPEPLPNPLPPSPGADELPLRGIELPPSQPTAPGIAVDRRR
jgi:hypothetical protein